MKTLALIAALACLAAPAALAKGHDQGRTEVPGRDVGTQTVTAAQGLGGAVGERPDGKGPKADNPARNRAGR